MPLGVTTRQQAIRQAQAQSGIVGPVTGWQLKHPASGKIADRHEGARLPILAADAQGIAHSEPQQASEEALAPVAPRGDIG